MAILWVHEGYQKEFGRKIDDYISELSDIKTQYKTAYDKVSSYSNDYNVNSCNSYLQKRQKDLQTAISSANYLKNTANSYVSTVLAADKSVANSIHTESYTFYKRKGIGPQSDTNLARAWNYFSTKASDFLHDVSGTVQDVIADIGEFYEKYKYIINIVFDFLAVSAALALFAMSGGTLLGIICGIGAMWATMKATYELATDCLAAEAWLNGDIGLAENLANRTLTEDLVTAAEWLDGKLGTNGVIKNFVKVRIMELEVCQFVATIMFVWEGFREIFNLKLRSDGKPLKILDHRVKLTAQQRELGWQAFKAEGTKGMGGRFASVVNWLKFGAWELKLSIKKDAKTVPEFVESLFDNRKTNAERIKMIISDPRGVISTLPGVPEAMKFWNTSKEIMAM